MFHLPTPRLAATTGLVCGLLLIGGCASDGTAGNPLMGLSTALKSPTEAGFFALVRQNCADHSIGGTPLDTLLDTDTQVRDLTAQLYRGDLSNDEYVNQLSQAFPSDDANIPAAGCVMNQLDVCLSSHCRPILDQAKAAVAETQAEAVARVPETDRAAVEAMTQKADTASPKGTIQK
ncbi:hypothetical protein F2Q65_12115 [Thiohalocapsa marina]|uniref:Uncharacterized protein n=1 Tax=Thiohalocapsa marina TaxID=424902 RepID=A0A5M8FL26_9GAMM|nr:hypothetical protein [Thiohalocapsa marina]KAA6184456.1 hypothetical protein F2Q65_12115 [Thiohalocapsa marina]